MNPTVITALFIPAVVSLFLVALFIKERYNYLPRTKKSKKSSDNKRDFYRDSDELISHQRNSEDTNRKYRDFSGGIMGI